MKTRSLRTFTLWLLCLALGLVSVGCGCQQHRVSAVTATPQAACLTIFAGGDISRPGSVGLCESLYLFGTNGCVEPLVITLPTAAGSDSKQKTVPAGEDFLMEVPGWSERSYDLQARLGAQTLSLHFAVGGQCGLTGGSCD